MWEYRELFWFLMWRDISVRYKQTALGASWAVLQPLLMMFVFSVFFGRLAKVPSDGAPYPVFAFCGLLPWQLFSYALARSAGSLVANERLVSKVYFPRIVVPVSAVLAGLVDFAVAFVVLLGLMFYYQIMPTSAVWMLPFLVLLTLVTAVGVGLGLSALYVQYRDISHALPFLTQFWMFATPIAYPSSLIPQPWRPLYGLNPMAGVVEGFRWALLGRDVSPASILFVSVLVALLTLCGSLSYFLRVERSLADVI